MGNLMFSTFLETDIEISFLAELWKVAEREGALQEPSPGHRHSWVWGHHSKGQEMGNVSLVQESPVR